MPAKGDDEVVYGPPWSGLDYSKPYNAIDKTALAPGSLNTTAINGFLCSSPWLAENPFLGQLNTGEYPIGYFDYSYQSTTGQNGTLGILVTNIGVYYTGDLGNQSLTAIGQIPLVSLYVWQPADLDLTYMLPNNCVSFVEVNNQVFFTGLMLNGVYCIYFGHSVTSVTITDPGIGYTTASISFSGGGGGTGAAATPIISSTGVVSSVQPITFGSGYQNGATASITGGGGSGATCTPIVVPVIYNYGVLAYNLTSGGTGYTSAPIVTVFPVLGGGGASARAYIEASGTITGATLTNGGTGYTAVPTVSISGDGTGATAVATIGVEFPSVPSFTQATGYVAGAYIMELGGRLVVGQCKFPTNGGTGTQVLPTIAWSSVGIYIGSGSNDPWNPLNISTLNGNIGGFQLLGDVPDQITGLCAIGQSGVIGRTNGLSQMDPGPSAIQPFNIYHFWSSNQGVGALPNTMVQWGQQIIFRSDDNVYMFSLTGGIQPIGTQIIAKMIQDTKSIAYNTTPTSAESSGLLGYWYYASIVNISGQLHYLLTASAPNVITAGVDDSFCCVYDFNIAEGSWHIWDLTEYYIQTTPNFFPMTSFTCPITALRPVLTYSNHSIDYQSAPIFLMIGNKALGSSQSMLQFVPFDYDSQSNITQNAFIAPLYPPLAIPNTQMYFRGETMALGHKITVRRLRLQVDNAPMPTIAAVAYQQADVTFTGQESSQAAVRLSLPGNTVPTKGPIKTYYGDADLSDEIVQASIQSVIGDSPWTTMPCFRIASVSMIVADTTSTTQ